MINNSGHCAIRKILSFAMLKSLCHEIKQCDRFVYCSEQASPQSTSTSNQAPSSLVVGLCSAAGALTSLCLLYCLARRFLGGAKDHSSMYAKSETCLDDSLVKCSLELSADILDKDNADKSFNFTCQNQISEADYSKEFEDILELMARLAINIKSLVNPLLRKDIEATVQHSNDLTQYDCAAALQLISKIEADDKFLVHTPDRMQLLKQRINEGPLTANHFLVLKLLCESEVHDTVMAVNEDKASVCPENSSQQTIQSTLYGEDKVPCDKPLLDVLQLLKNCDLEPSYLMQNESRKLIEDSLSNRQGPLLAEHLAVMQLISKAEIESGLSMDSMRKCLLEKRIKEGPLNAGHLKATLSLRQAEGATLPEWGPIVPAGSGEQDESVDIPNNVGDIAEGCGILTQENRDLFFIDTISGLEVKTSLLSREERSALQLMELRAKTARIRQSLPEWVKNGLVPPRHNRETSPPGAVLAESRTNFADQHAGKGAVQISCSVQADLGFPDDFMPRAAPAKMQQDALESQFLGGEQYVNIAPHEQQPAPGWQAGPLAGELAGEVLRLSPAPPSTRKLGSSLAWLSSALSSCLRALLGACSSGLGCLIRLGKCPGSGNRA
jgi:hypothetical protein